MTLIQILGILIYLTGSVFAYVIFKRHSIKEDGKWTIGAKFPAILLAIMSWVGVGLALFESHSDDPAKW